MVVIRCTAHLLTKMKIKPDLETQPSTSRLGDWYAQWVYARPHHMILCVAEKTLLPVLIPAKDLSAFPLRLKLGVRDILRTWDVDEAQISAELAEMDSVIFSKTASRSILGSMNDFVRMLEGQPWAERPNYFSLWLSETPCSPLGMDNPERATRALFGCV